MKPTCLNKEGVECDDYRCLQHHAPEIKEQRENMDKGKKLLKRWCVNHRQSYYGEACGTCIQLNILLYLAELVKRAGGTDFLVDLGALDAALDA